MSAEVDAVVVGAGVSGLGAGVRAFTDAARELTPI